MNRVKSLIKDLIYRMRGEISTVELVRRGLSVGMNFHRLNQVIIDDSHPWLVEIGNDVTLAPRVHIIAHDASTKEFLGYTKIGKVTIGDRVFVGAGSVILPGVTIGNDVIIGANSTVTSGIPDNVVAAGNPARVICSIDEYIKKEQERMKSSPIYGEDYILGTITEQGKQKQKSELNDGKIGFVK